MPETTVVIPTYNRESAVVRAIESVLDQDYQKFEILVVDDCSDDNTVDVVQNIQDERVSITQHDSNKGGNAARNTGIKKSQGDYICFLDSDDELSPNHLRVVVDQLEKRSQDCAGVTTGYYKYVDGEQISSWSPHMGKITLSTALGKNERFRSQKNVIGGFSCTTFRSSIFETVGLLDEQLASLQDLDFYIRVLENNYIYGVQDQLVIYHIGGDQISSNIEAKIQGKKQFIQKHDALLDNNMLANFHYTMGFVFAERDEMRSAADEFKKSITAYPIHPLYYYHYIGAKLGKKPFNTLTLLKRNVKEFVTN